MLQRIKQLIGSKIEALDGEIGHVKDFYFDDRNWVVRYVIVDTASWVPGRLVLLSPHAFVNVYPEEEGLSVSLNRKQIENSPSIDLHKPVSRQYEEEYYRHYGWPTYWQGDGLWGMGGLPAQAMMMSPFPEWEQGLGEPPSAPDDTHLRSTQAVDGYHLYAGDENIGKVCDYMMDTQSWAIHHLVIETGNWFSGREVEIPARKVNRISYEESCLFTTLSREEIEKSPAPHPV